MAAPPQTSLRPVALTFLVFGTFWGAWAVAAADIERELGIGHGAFGVLLSVSLGAAAAANAVGGGLAERHGTDRTLAAALLMWSAVMAVGAAAQEPAVFVVALVAIVSLGGVVDVVMNVAATSALAGQPGRLVRFHGLFNLGAAGGAAGVGLALSAGASWRWAWAATAVAALGASAVVARAPLPAGGAGEHVPLGGAVALLRAERLGIVAAAFAVGALVEGGIELWGVLFLRTSLPDGLTVGATSAVIGYLVATGARVLLGGVVGRRGADRGVAVGGATAAAGIVVLAAVDHPVVAGAGLVVAAGGISMCWPLLLSLAAAGRARPGPAVGAVTSVGYLGFVLGPTVVGWLAAAFGLRLGVAVLAVAAAFVAAAPALRRRMNEVAAGGA